MSKVCLDQKMIYGLGALLAGIILLLLAYFKSFLSVMVVLVALAAIFYGAVLLGLMQRIVGFGRGLLKK